MRLALLPAVLLVPSLLAAQAPGAGAATAAAPVAEWNITGWSPRLATPAPPALVARSPLADEAQGSRARRTLFGAAIGAGAGAILGYVGTDECDDVLPCTVSRGGGAALGAILGALIGGTVAYFTY